MLVLAANNLHFRWFNIQSMCIATLLIALWAMLIGNGFLVNRTWGYRVFVQKFQVLVLTMWKSASRPWCILWFPANQTASFLPHRRIESAICIYNILIHIQKSGMGHWTWLISGYWHIFRHVCHTHIYAQKVCEWLRIRSFHIPVSHVLGSQAMIVVIVVIALPWHACN